MKQVSMPLNKKRFFAFGCSYTKYKWPTWADLVGINFSEFYNYGRSGASNNYIFNRVVEASEKYNFNAETDFVMIGLTGLNRFSFFKDKKWNTNGELHAFSVIHPESLEKTLVDTVWDINGALYNSWVCIKGIENILSAKGIPHNIFMALDNRHFIANKNMYDLSESSVRLVKDLILTYPSSLHDWCIKNYSGSHWHVGDGHPTTQMNYDFLKAFYPELISIKTEKFLEEIKNLPPENFYSYQNTYDKAWEFSLFGDNEE
jgi:hypothetical protein